MNLTILLMVALDLLAMCIISDPDYRNTAKRMIQERVGYRICPLSYLEIVWMGVQGGLIVEVAELLSIRVRCFDMLASPAVHVSIVVAEAIRAVRLAFMHQHTAYDTQVAQVIMLGVALLIEKNIPLVWHVLSMCGVIHITYLYNLISFYDMMMSRYVTFIVIGLFG